MFGCVWTNGQICSATSRLLVHEKVADKFLATLVEQTKKIPIVNPNTPEAAELTGILGPVVSANQHRRITDFIDGALKEGAQLLTGGKRPASHSKGYFVEPTIVKVTPNMRIW